MLLLFDFPFFYFNDLSFFFFLSGRGPQFLPFSLLFIPKSLPISTPFAVFNFNPSKISLLFPLFFSPSIQWGRGGAHFCLILIFAALFLSLHNVGLQRWGSSHPWHQNPDSCCAEFPSARFDPLAVFFPFVISICVNLFSLPALFGCLKNVLVNRSSMHFLFVKWILGFILLSGGRWPICGCDLEILLIFLGVLVLLSAGIMFQDITTLLLDPKAFKNTIDLFVERYKGKNISVVAGEKEVKEII